MNGSAEGPRLGWNRDPTGRNFLRWYDGDGWSADVSDGRTMFTDWSTVPLSTRRRSLFSMLVSLTPALVLLALVAFAIRN